MDEPSKAKSPGPIAKAINVLGLYWEFTESNFDTFVIPNSTFGILSALAADALAHGPPPTLISVLTRAPLVILFNWHNVFNFDLANQRQPESIQEDRINKPWRPIVTGKVSAEQTRRAMLLTIPSALLLNYLLGVWKQGVFILIITWLYNDIRGSDEVVRDLLISVAYGLFNSASMEIAMGTENNRINHQGVAWVAIISGVIFTTMQIQDLKDQAGDSTRGRRSVALLLGDTVSRASLVVFLCLWSLVCPYFWQAGLVGYAMSIIPAAVISLRLILWRSVKDDARSWRWWCFWTCMLYFQPLLRGRLA